MVSGDLTNAPWLSVPPPVIETLLSDAVWPKALIPFKLVVTLKGIELIGTSPMVVRATTVEGIVVGGMKETYGYDIGNFIGLGDERTLVSDGSSSSGSA